MFVNGMSEDENHHLGKVHNDGEYLNVRYKRNSHKGYLGPKRYKDVMLPLNFSTYCVSIFHISKAYVSIIEHLDW